LNSDSLREIIAAKSEAGSQKSEWQAKGENFEKLNGASGARDMDGQAG
jgi:hypothetical protein